jgi:elongation factor P
VEKTYNNGSRVKDVRLDNRQEQYLYNDGEFYHFMDTDTFEQIMLGPDTLEGVTAYLLDNMVVELESYESEPLNVSLPTTVDLKVVWAEAAVAGDTANSPSKQVELETGLKMQVPMFVNEGDVIRVDTRDGNYVTRVQK